MISKKARGWDAFCTCLEWASLLAVMHYCINRFFGATMFGFTYDETFRTVTFSVLVVLGLLRLAVGQWREMREAAGEKAERAVLVKGCLALLFSVPCILLTQQFNYLPFVYLPFVAFCLYGMDSDKVLKAHVITIGTVLAATILCSLSGAVPNLLYRTVWGELRGSYGVYYPTGCAAYFAYLILFAWGTQKKQSWSHTVFFICLALLVAYGSHVYCQSRTGLMTMLLMAAAVLYEQLYETVFSKHRGTRWIGKLADALTLIAFPAFGAVVFILTWIYGSGSELGIRLNALLSDRLYLVWTSIEKYGIQAFGALTPQSGWGGSLIKVVEYEFLDSSYSLLLIRYGWVFTLIAVFLWIWMTQKAIHTGHRRLALAMGIIAFHCFSEHRFPEIHYNILLAMPLCCFISRKQTKAKPAGEKKQLAIWIAGGVTVAAGVLLLPGLLSKARLILERNGWLDTGDSRLCALFFWLFLLSCGVLCWMVLSRLLTGLLERKRIHAGWYAGTAAVAALLVCCVVWINGQVKAGLPAYEARLSADRDAVELLLSAAKDPVYAGQAEEAYKQKFRGFSDRVFTEEELARGKRGSILLDLDQEGFQLTFAGARYAELSPYSGLFTYDQAVVDRLSAAGYPFHRYYTAEQTEDLPAFAEVNGLDVTENGGLMVRGSKHSLFAGPYLNLYYGQYMVTYTLRLADPAIREQNGDREVCELKVGEQYGKNLVARQVLYAKDFDEDGKVESITLLEFEDRALQFR